LRGFSQRFAAILWTDMSPTCRAKADSRSPNRLWRESPTGDVEEFKGYVEQRFRREACVAHHPAQSKCPPRAKKACERHSQVAT
jgi:hypothetical protein